MLKSKSMGGTAADCTNYCTGYFGGHFVIVVNNEVFHLDDQARARIYAGRREKITGILDSRSSTIRILQIEPR